MPSDLVLQIQDHLADYLAGRVTLEEFRDWFSPKTWDVDECGDLEAQKLAHLIEHRINEFTSGAWDESELVDLLRAALSGETLSSANETTSLITTPAAPASRSENVFGPTQNPSLTPARSLTLA